MASLVDDDRNSVAAGDRQVGPERGGLSSIRQL
jgi:hypothetical protein